MSGGQKQRLCIARALLKNPKILILDDSTSAVDTKTDSLIRSAFETEIPGTTTIIIAQRLSSVSHADQIIVLDDGRIKERGTHEELMAAGGEYREIYDSQNAASESEWPDMARSGKSRVEDSEKLEGIERPSAASWPTCSTTTRCASA